MKLVMRTTAEMTRQLQLLNRILFQLLRLHCILYVFSYVHSLCVSNLNCDSRCIVYE